MIQASRIIDDGWLGNIDYGPVMRRRENVTVKLITFRSGDSHMALAYHWTLIIGYDYMPIWTKPLCKLMLSLIKLQEINQ